MPEDLDRTLPFVDVAFFSGAGRTDRDCAELLRACAARGVAIAVATRGADGVMAVAGGHLHRRGAEPARVVDTLGAREGFIAAFLMAHLRGTALEAALYAGVCFAAQVCGWRGGFGHGETWNGEGASLARRAPGGG